MVMHGGKPIGKHWLTIWSQRGQQSWSMKPKLNDYKNMLLKHHNRLKQAIWKTIWDCLRNKEKISKFEQCKY